MLVHLAVNKIGNMKLGEFIEKLVEPNSLIRLLYKTKGGHEVALNDWNDVSMEWEVLKAKGKNRHYIDNEVIGVVDILVRGSHYSEAINIVIEKLENQPQVKENVEVIQNNIFESCE
jgi:hypothetical protein